MKLLVSCDQVFDCLTRGPFPSGSPDDEAVQRHLEACHECRQLAEALRPAVELLHEALPASEAAGLPAYGELEEDDSLCQRADGALAARIRQIIDRNEVQPRRVAFPDVRLTVLRYTAVAVLLAALGTLLTGVVWPKHSERMKLASPTFAADFQPTADGLLRLAALNLPADCFSGVPMPVMEVSPRNGAVGGTHDCCTRCHAAGKEGAVLTHRAVLALQESCAACHKARS